MTKEKCLMVMGSESSDGNDCHDGQMELSLPHIAAM